MTTCVLALIIAVTLASFRLYSCALYENTLHERAALGDLDHFKGTLAQLQSQEPWNGAGGLQVIAFVSRVIRCVCLPGFYQSLLSVASMSNPYTFKCVQNLLSSCYAPENSTCYSKSGCLTGSCSILAARSELLCQTPLHAAAIGRQADIVEFQISELGVDPNIRTERGTTPLAEAFYSFTVYW